jgi:general stress protein 26
MQSVLDQSLALVNQCGVALVGSVDASGFPNIKAMLKMENEGLRTFWFSTNTSSKRVARFRENPRACVYFMNADSFTGLMLVGNMEVLRDPESRQRLWREGFERYYPLGADDPDYTVLRFTAVRGNLYCNLKNADFEIQAEAGNHNKIV